MLLLPTELLPPTGWFPAKFVEVLDERSKEVRMCSYSLLQPLMRDILPGPCPK